MSQYKKTIANPEKDYSDRTEILMTDYYLQPRVEDIIGMKVEEVRANSKYFTLVCSDFENGRGMRIHVSRSHYYRFDRPESALMISAMEIIYKTEQEKKKWEKKEEAGREKLSMKWYEK